MTMTGLPNDWFETKFDSDIKLVFQQMSSKLMNRMFTVRDVQAKTVQFPILGKSVVTKNKPSHADQEAQVGGHTHVTCTLDDYTTGRYAGKLDVRKFTGNVYDKYVQAQAGAAGREIDIISLTAADSFVASPYAITTSGGLTYEKLTAGVALFHKNGTFSVPGMKTLIVDDEGWMDLVAETEFTRSDFVAYRATQTGTVPMVLGFEVVTVAADVVPLRDVGGAGKTYAYLIHENAIGLAIGQDVESEINYVAQKFSDFVGLSFSCGSVGVLEGGIVRIAVGQS